LDIDNETFLKIILYFRRPYK